MKHLLLLRSEHHGPRSFPAGRSDRSGVSEIEQGMQQKLYIHSLQANGSTVILDPVEFGQEGPWALSLWFRPTPTGLVGDQFEYLFSQGNADTTYATGFEANQVKSNEPKLSPPGKSSYYLF